MIVAGGHDMTARCIQRRLEQSLGADPARQRAPRAPGLSRQEAEVLHRLATGHKAADIAAHLSVSEAAVKDHIKSLLYKAWVSSKPNREGAHPSR